MLKHKHHIIPKHIGGTDDQSNLVELTIEEHAEAHRVLFEEHGRWQDFLAWQGLAGLVGKDEMLKAKYALYSGINHHMYGKKRPEHAELMREAMKGENNPMYGKPSPFKGVSVPEEKRTYGEKKARYGNQNGKGNIGITRTEEQNKANSEKMKRIWTERRAKKEQQC